jgi:hypothetical protein
MPLLKVKWQKQGNARPVRHETVTTREIKSQIHDIITRTSKAQTERNVVSTVGFFMKIDI